MNWKLKAFGIVLGSIGLTGVVFAADPTTAPAPAAVPTDSRVPQYRVRYEPPTAQQITEVIGRVRDHLEATVRPRLVDDKSSADASAAQSQASSGGGPKIGAYSYPLGVVYSGMLLAHEVTGDKKFADFVAKRFQSFADDLPKYEKQTGSP